MKIVFDPCISSYSVEWEKEYCDEVVALFRSLGHDVFYACEVEVPEGCWDDEDKSFEERKVDTEKAIQVWVDSKIKDNTGNCNVDYLFTILKMNKKRGKKRMVGNIIYPQRKGTAWINNTKEMLQQSKELMSAFVEHEYKYFNVK